MPGLGLLASAAPIDGYAVSGTAVMVNGNTIFTITTGPIWIRGLVSLCITGNGATATTIQYSVTPTVGAAPQTISAASGSLLSAAAGASVSLLGTALSTAANLNANGPNLGMTSPIFCPSGTITLVVAVGSTTGTWRHHMWYTALTGNVVIS